VSLEDLSQAFRNLEKQVQLLDGNKKLLHTNFQEVQKNLQSMIQESNDITINLQKSLDEIEKYQQRMSIAKQRLSLIEKDYSLHKEYFSSYTNLLYKIQNELYSDVFISKIKLFAKSDDIADTITQEEFIRILSDKIQFLLYDLQMQQQSYESSLAQMNYIYLEYEKKVKDYENELAWVELQRKELVELFSLIQQGQSDIQSQMNQINKEKYDVNQEIQQIQQTSKASKIIQSKVTDLVSKSDRDIGSKYFTWPVLPIQKILYYYQDADRKKQENSDHIWLRVSVAQWIEVYSPAAGIVYKVQDSGDKNTLRRVIVVHKNGFVSIILPLSNIVVKEWQSIERGQIIWLSWGKPWTKWAWTLQQSQLYRELYKDWEAVDPLLFLETSIFSSKESLIEKYWSKYDDDLMQRTIRVDEAKTLFGKTPSQRVSLFLAQHAPEPYNDAKVWIEGSKSTGIDPYFGICVGWAETSYRNFKSTNNIGNVGNDDSGNTRVFATAQEWIEALFNVLNNRYLGNYNTIDQLSRYGNSDGFIYASSPFNWQNNITKCLSSIYW
jgi:murein DD-endopeptidase MepM/ murein hydrolase activator NlpD